MQVPFTHPLATHPAGTILGYRTDGRPIYPIAGGSGEGDGGSGSASSGQAGSDGQGQSGQGGDGSEGQGSGQGGQQSGSGVGDGDTTDWRAEAKKWEKRSKDNHAELEQLRQQNMSDAEKALTDAEKKGRTAAASEYGKKLASAEFRAAVAAAGMDLGEAAELIDVNRFVGDDGEVNVQAIKSAVTKLSKLAPARGAGRSGGDMGGGSGSGDQSASLDKQIEAATKARNFAEVVRLKRLRTAQTT